MGMMAQPFPMHGLRPPTAWFLGLDGEGQGERKGCGLSHVRCWLIWLMCAWVCVCVFACFCNGG